MKTIIGIFCIVLPVVLAYHDTISPTIKKVINPLNQKAI